MSVTVAEFVLFQMPFSVVLFLSGYFSFVDSLQTDDKPDYNWALEGFPKDFHEPFFKNYVQHPMKELIEEAGFEVREVNYGFLSKCVVARKPSAKS